MTTIYLVRHGDVHNPEQILYGRIPGFRLSDKGRDQANAAGTYLAERPIAAIYASPQQRAQETAGIIAGFHPELTVITKPRLDETHTPYEGRPLAEMAARDWDLYTGVGPEYDSPQSVLDRVLNFIHEAREKHAGQHVVAVTHGDPVVFSFMHFKQIVSDVLKDRLALVRHGIADEYPATASVTEIVFPDGDGSPDVRYVRPY